MTAKPAAICGECGAESAPERGDRGSQVLRHAPDCIANELGGRRFQKHLDKMHDDILGIADRIAGEHPLDTLLSMMRSHGWGEDDPMVRLAVEATKVPYPMPRWEAVEKGLLE